MIVETILHLFQNGPKSSQTITSENPLYYYFRAEEKSDKKKNPFGLMDLSSTANIEKSDFYELPITPDVAEEVTFLEHLGLAFRKEKTTYIYDIAEVLYGPAGYFRNLDSVGAKQEFLTILYNFILPGRFWTAYRARSQLPDDVQPSVALEAHMREIFDLVWSLMR